MPDNLIGWFWIALLLLAQNISFTVVSRARQSQNLWYHAIASAFSNGTFIFVFTELVVKYDSLFMKIWYIIWTVIGSILAHYYTMKWIERGKRKVSGTRLVTYEELQQLSVETQVKIDLLQDQSQLLEKRLTLYQTAKEL